MIAPPFTRPLEFRCRGPSFISAVSFFGARAVTRKPSDRDIPPLRIRVQLSTAAASSRFAGSRSAPLLLFIVVVRSFRRRILLHCERFPYRGPVRQRDRDDDDERDQCHPDAEAEDLRRAQVAALVHGERGGALR